jgi:hypothetical protein
LPLAARGGGEAGVGLVATGVGRDAASAGGDSGAGGRTGALEQATRLPTIAQPNHRHRRSCMTLILLEALGAGLLLVLIVWWTMFSGRERGELQQDDPPDSAPHREVTSDDKTPAHPSGQADPTEPKR